MAVHPHDKNTPTLDKILQESFEDMGKGEKETLSKKLSEESPLPAEAVSQEKPQDYEYNKVYKSNEVSSMQLKRKGLSKPKEAPKTEVKTKLSSSQGDDFDIEW